MSASRAAVFTQQSQSVEVFVEDAWWPGWLLGWRHDGGGACEVWVRVTVDGADRETWTGLAEVRLPEARSAPSLVPDTEAGSFPGPAEELLPGASGAPPLSLSEAAAREQVMAGATTPTASRQRRRHGGDVTAELPAAHGGALAGRHRAGGLGVAGRHRALDAPPFADEMAQPESVPQLGEAPGADVSDATVLMPRATEADCLTRPLRLGDRVARPRLVRPDTALRASGGVTRG